MSNNKRSRNHIIEITTELLKEYSGDTKKITSRIIAERAEIGLGSINYFFGSKENLITECIQRSINKMLIGFKPDITAPAKEDASKVIRKKKPKNYLYLFLFLRCRWLFLQKILQKKY